MTDLTDKKDTTDISALPPASRALIVLNSTKTEEHLNALVVEAAPIIEVTNPAAREQAHRVGMKLKNARITIEKTGKTAREDAQAFSKAVIDEQKRLINIITSQEDRVMGLRDGYDAKIEAEKTAKAAAEKARVDEIQSKIAGIRGLPLALAGETSEQIAAEWQALIDFKPVPEVFGEFIDDCASALVEASNALNELYLRVKSQEDAAAANAVEAERLAELERLAQETLAAERKALEAERAAIAAEREAIAKERAALEAAKVPVESAAVPGTIIEVIPSGDIPADTDVMVNLVDEMVKNMAPEPVEPAQAAIETVAPVTATEWRIRRAALATADQFTALAGKVAACGFAVFSNNLLEVAALLRDGTHDAALAGADYETLVGFDNDLLDATVNAIDALEVKEVMVIAA